MKFTNKSKVALNVLLEIAAHTTAGIIITLPLVSKRLKVSCTYLETIFSLLKDAGLIKSYRGPSGGYSLSKDIKLISLLDVVHAIDKPEFSDDDLSVSLWSEFNSYMQQQLTMISIDQLLNECIIHIEPELKEKRQRLKYLD